jgi:hypothetical protein
MKSILMLAAVCVALRAEGAAAGCAKFSCVNTNSGRCYFVVFRTQERETRFELGRDERRWISGVAQGDTYCATLRNQQGEACPIRPVRDIKDECPPALMSLAPAG